jgi:ubiquinone biosynthesis protein
VNLQHRRLEPSVNRLVMGIVTAALFLGSTQILTSDTPPILFGISVPGVLGIGAAALLGVRLLRAIHRSQDLG